MRIRHYTVSHCIAFMVLLWLLSGVAHATPDYRAYLVKWEGVRYEPYKDGNHLAVGIGHNLTAYQDMPKVHYSADEVEAFFAHDLEAALKAARQGVKDFDSLPDRAKEVVVGLIWCVGPKGFMRFKQFRFSLGIRAYMAAGIELVDSRWYKQVAPRRARAAYETLWNL